MWSGSHLVWWREWGAVCTDTEANFLPWNLTWRLTTIQGQGQIRCRPLYWYTVLKVHLQLPLELETATVHTDRKGMNDGHSQHPHSAGEPDHCTRNHGPALWWRSRGLHWLSRASTLVKVQGTALELRASTPLRVQGTELAVIPHQPFQGLQLHNPLYVCTEYCI